MMKGNTMSICQSCGQYRYLIDGVICEPCDYSYLDAMERSFQAGMRLSALYPSNPNPWL